MFSFSFRTFALHLSFSKWNNIKFFLARVRLSDFTERRVGAQKRVAAAARLRHEINKCCMHVMCVEGTKNKMYVRKTSSLPPSVRRASRGKVNKKLRIPLFFSVLSYLRFALLRVSFFLSLLELRLHTCGTQSGM